MSNHPRLAFLAAVIASFVYLPASAASFALCIHETPAQIAARTDPQASAAYWRSFASFGEQLKIAGILRNGSAFDTRTPAKVVKAGQSAHTAEAVATHVELFSGYFIIEVATLDEALAWAARVPNPGGRVSVHTLLPMMAN